MYNAVIAQMLKVSHTQTLQQEWEPTINLTPTIFVVGELAYHYQNWRIPKICYFDQYSQIKPLKYSL